MENSDVSHLERDRWPEFESELRCRRRIRFDVHHHGGTPQSWQWMACRCKTWAEAGRVLNRHRQSWQRISGEIRLDEMHIFPFGVDHIHRMNPDPNDDRAERRREQFRAAAARRRSNLSRIDILVEPSLADEFREVVRERGDVIQDVLTAAKRKYIDRHGRSRSS